MSGAAERRFTAYMRKRREMLGMSQACLAREMGERGAKIDPSAIARMEKGQRKTTLDEAFLISRILGVDLAYMTSPEWPHDLRQWMDEQHIRQLQIQEDRQ